MTEKKKHKKTPYQNWLVPGVIGLVFLAFIGFLVKVFLSPDGPRHKEKISTVTLLKPPPEVKEKPPEPQIQKEAPKETIVTPNDTPQPQQAQDQPQDNSPPAGSDLGVDAEGGAGSDGFGLVGKKGGRAITLGGGGGGGLGRLSLLSKYGGYSQKMTDDIRKKVFKVIEQNGGVPKGKYQTVVHVTLDDKGKVLKYRLVGSSGNPRLDEAFKVTLNDIKFSTPPPDGMPLSMTLKITMSQG